ncbi:MAG: restriction endonuclease [Deltaproteobacteria bacterium GWC2_65_14]|nr:MAG: restriction endonuclease [Deltaproteobacteria bacterium GWC2_65_14]
MNAFVGITDWDWFDLLRTRPELEEVNFWQPSGSRQFRALNPGELFLFKLHSPRNYIVGGGLFAHSSLLPISLAWEAFGMANGAADLVQMRSRVERYRRQGQDHSTDYIIGCILLEQPFFLREDQWVGVPHDWSPNIVQGRGYDLTVEPGLTLWARLQTARGAALEVREEEARYGRPILSLPRLGQGSFRVIVTDAYERRCALTNERTLPALDAAHIKPYSDSGGHRVENGLLLRRDLHALFDRGYVTVTPDLVVEVSRRIREEFENGRDYYRLHGEPVRPPGNPVHRPSAEYLRWHNECVFRG